MAPDMPAHSTFRNELQPPRRRRKRKLGRHLFMVAAIFVAGIGSYYGLELAFDPWASPLTGQPTLTGYWEGKVSLSPGNDRQFVLQLKSAKGKLDISGDGKTCGAAGAATYEVWGDVLNYRGTRFTLHMRLWKEATGLRLSGLDGVWDGDVLKIWAESAAIDPDGAHRSNHQPADPPPFEMRRVSKATFETACTASGFPSRPYQQTQWFYATPKAPGLITVPDFPASIDPAKTKEEL